MNYNNVKRKIKRLSSNTSLNNQVFRKVKGSYYLYNIYKLTNNNGLWEVQRRGDFVHDFESSAIATTWCLADKEKQYMDANHIMVIDRKLQRKKIDVQIRTKFLNQDNISPERKVVAIARITQDLYICNSLRSEIDVSYTNRINIHNLQDFKL